jgi:hypothetical protein
LKGKKAVGKKRGAVGFFVKKRGWTGVLNSVQGPGPEFKTRARLEAQNARGEAISLYIFLFTKKI